MAEISEQTQVAEVQTRLSSKFPEVAADEVAAIVARAHARFTSSSIRDFVPLLVERSARDELTKMSSQLAMA